MTFIYKKSVEFENINGFLKLANVFEISAKKSYLFELK